MRKENKSTVRQKANSMNAMDQGTNLVSQVINNATGLDKGNDGKVENK
ncbi:hypothetical protein WMO40_00810 [Bacillaceae bacterium CLA-AA-H227]|uniref:Uncharacterized protein n=1 Tax=Robertmurraya yapensis (ex Hitch et al 2024) TaxID=3133160 RepID=A0ACC6S5D6_9BACI